MTCATAIASWIGEPSKPYERSWKRLEEVRQLGHEAAGAAGAAQPLGMRAREERLVRHVEPDHRDRDPAREDSGRRLRVDERVELRRRRDVSFGDRAAHPDDALEPVGTSGAARA